MAQKKLQRFEEIRHFKNVLQYPENMAGNWHQFFNNKEPITLELACGKGEYTLGLGRMYPHRNFLGVDIKGNRIWRGAKTALEEHLQNVAFLRTQIDRIHTYFQPGEVDEIWLTFPDPQLRTSRLRKRLTHPKFLRLYQQIIKADGCIHLKTDSPALYTFTKEIIHIFRLPLLQETNDLYAQTDMDATLKIKTHYEQLDIAGSQKIFYLKFLINKPLPPAWDDEVKRQIQLIEHGGKY